MVVVALALIGVSAVAVTAKEKDRMIPIADSIDDIIRRLDDSIRRELDLGCVRKEANGRLRFCDSSEKKIGRLHDDARRAADSAKSRRPDERRSAETSIRRFSKDDRMTLTYKSTTPNPYADDGSVIETYADDDGNEYWIDPRGETVVQMGPVAGPHPPAHKTGPEDRLTAHEMRDIAVELIQANVPEFSRIRSSLHPLEDNRKKEVYFFRWEDYSSTLAESEMAPFIQVGLYADGRIASYTNTLKREAL
jgi:hypothetical protein